MAARTRRSPNARGTASLQPDTPQSNWEEEARKKYVLARAFRYLARIEARVKRYLRPVVGLVLSERTQTTPEITPDGDFYALALADANEAVKEALWGYDCHYFGHCKTKIDMRRLLSIATQTPRDFSQPDSILVIPSELSKSIEHTSRARNHRFHDKPEEPVTKELADEAIRTAQAVQDLINQVDEIAAGVSRQSLPRRPDWIIISRRWMRRVPAFSAIAAVCLAVGIGSALARTGIPFDQLLSDMSPGVTVTALPAAMPTQISTPGILVAGSLVAEAPVCQAGQATVQLLNTGATPLQFSAGSPDAPSATFALTPGTTGQPTVSGTIAPSASVILYVTTALMPGTFHIDVLAPAGTIHLSASAC